MKYPNSRCIRKIKGTVKRKGVDFLHPTQKGLYDFVMSEAYDLSVSHYMTQLTKSDENGLKLLDLSYMEGMLNNPERYAIDDKIILVVRKVYNLVAEYQTKLRSEVRTNDDDEQKSVLNRNSIALGKLLDFIKAFYSRVDDVSDETVEGTSTIVPSELFHLRAKDDMTMTELVNLINTLNFAISPEIFATLPDGCKRHFEKGTH
jgi:hypothetical protein